MNVDWPAPRMDYPFKCTAPTWLTQKLLLKKVPIGSQCYSVYSGHVQAGIDGSASVFPPDQPSVVICSMPRSCAAPAFQKQVEVSQMPIS